MTETTTERPPPVQPPSSTPPLLRPPHDRVVRGVCAAIGRTTGTDPVLWRVLVVVLAVFGGSGIVLYLAGWLLIPEEGAERSELQRLMSRDGRSPLLQLGLVGLVVVGVLVAFGGDALGIVPALVIGGLVWLVLRERQSAAPADAGWTSPPEWTSSPAAGYGPPPGPVFGPPAPPAPPAPRRPRSSVGPITVSVVAVVVGLMLMPGLLTVTPSQVLATALLITGAGLLVATVWGRARGLIALAVVLAVTLGAVSSFEGRFGTTDGDRTWVVDGRGQYELGAGEATLDLRPLAGGGRAVPVEARVGLGELVVLVPADVDLDLDASVGIGEIRVTGPDGTRSTDAGADLSREELLEGSGDGRRVRLEVRVGAGELEVRRVAA